MPIRSLRTPATDASMEILQITQVTDELLRSLLRLVPELDADAAPPTRQHLERVVASRGSALLIAREQVAERPIVGMLTLVCYAIPTGTRAWIEDVVVDPAVRGRRIGAALVRAALDLARSEGATKVDLTSRPEREAANRLYQRIGFELRETRVYRYLLEDPDG